ncbi:MAG: hypothetical protein JNK38_11420 [Acidobacteria bacterium]|nr:hypothetical protein [Acidobacteriota bacterium]
MDFLQITVAVLTLMVAGLGLGLLALPDRRKNALELFASSVLFGSAFVSVSLFLQGLLISGALLRWSVAALCLTVGAIGIWRKGLPKMRWGWPATNSGKWVLLIGGVQLVALVWLNAQRVLGWDGLFNFEAKARLIFQNGGSVPMHLFFDPSRSWMLQSYPLLLPLTESWLYLWLGREDQQLVKLLFPLFFASALCLVNVGGRLLGADSWRSVAAPLLLLTVPLLFIGDGSASSGYADFPLAVFYLASVISLLDFWRYGDTAALRLTGMLAACGCWLKQEGAILWACLMMIAVIALFRKRAVGRDWLALAKAAVPGLLFLVGWQWFVRMMSLPDIRQFAAINPESFRTGWGRIPIVAWAVLAELGNVRFWGVLWFLVAVTIGLLVWRRELSNQFVLPLAILLPFTLYSSVYLFSLWPSFVIHLESSFSRLLIHLSLAAVLMVGSLLRIPQTVCLVLDGLLDSARLIFRGTTKVKPNTFLSVSLIFGSALFSSCGSLSKVNQQLTNVVARQPMARSAGGPYATTDTYLRSLEIPNPSERVLAAVTQVPENDAMMFIAPSRTPEIELTYRVIASLSWPREVGALHCRLGDATTAKPEFLFQPRKEKQIRWLFMYRTSLPVGSKSVTEIGPHLKLVPIEEAKEWTSYCSP